MKTSIKTNLLVTAALLAMTVTTATAKSWRINNDANMKPDFTDINAAMDSDDVQPGDTLYLDAGCTITTNQKITKRVTVIGTGYFRPDAPHAHATISGELRIEAEYTKFESVSCSGQVYVYADNVTVERCKLSGRITLSNNPYGYYNARFATIRQCYIEAFGSNAVTGVSPGTMYDSCSSFATIENCILNNSEISGLLSPTIKNNVIFSYNDYPLANMGNAIVMNNIFINRGDNTKMFNQVTGSTITNNVIVASEADFPAYAANNLFVAEQGVLIWSGSNDVKFQLAEDSPAKGYGILGGVAVDCGAFGGPNPYVLNGLPAGFPYYTESSVDTRSKNGKVNVSLKIKMQDE